jgi:outer membrane PBP1 activator LpoA protein
MGAMLPATPMSVQLKRLPGAILVLLWSAVALVACVPEPTRRAPPPTQGLESRALDAVEAGDARQAAELYERLAEQAQGTARADYLLAAARQRLAANELAAADQRLTMAAAQASAQQRITILLLQAELARRLGQPAVALARLAELPTPRPPAVQPEALAVAGQALFALDRATEAVATLAERETLLTRPADVLANQRLIWDGLAVTTVSETPAPTDDSVLAGWLALHSAATMARSDPFSLPPALNQWRAGYPGHPANRFLIDDLLLNAQLMSSYPGQVALLLPLSGRQQVAARAVRDGLLAAHLATSGEARPELRVYDTSRLGPAQAYFQAEQDGADFIIGPLLKTAVEAVMGAAGRVGTLTLNFAAPELETPPGLFQFSLAPEDEAAEVARRAIAEGQTQGVALVANNDWGIRVLTSFRNEFEALGGKLLEFKGYDPASQDFSGAITSLLQLDQSNQRWRRLSANLGGTVEFQPRRRQDIDLIFLAAEAPAARLLRPQLRFHYAQDIPTYATSGVYAPGDGRSNRDLSGVRFPDIPWLVAPDASAAELQTTIETYWPKSGPRLIRLYAMGHDAYRMIPLLFNQGDMLSLRWEGLSGQLTVDARGRIHRRLAWAQFRAGKLVPFEPLSELDDMESTTGTP